jgi:hypothetical protein
MAPPLVSEPDGKYLTHVTPDGKTAEPGAAAITEFVKEHDLGKNWKVVDADSTNVNTGWETGIITRCEKKVNHRLHNSICMLHTDELPLRHLFDQLHGSTSGKSSFKGPLGNKLSSVEHLLWSNSFVPISEGPGIRPLPEE